MARSSYIYILLTVSTDTVVGAFTVKHEMEEFRKTYSLATYYRRYRDGQPNVDPVTVA